MLTKKDLTYLSDLARIEIPGAEEEKILKDLEEILNHFEELKEVGTKNIEPMTGGTFSENVFRSGEAERLPNKKALEEFPDAKDGFLKIPPVF